MGRSLYPSAPLGSLVRTDRTGHRNSVLDLQASRSGGSNSHPSSSTPNKEGTLPEGEARDSPTRSRHPLSILWSPVINTGFAMLLPRLRRSQNLASRIVTPAVPQLAPTLRPPLSPCGQTTYIYPRNVLTNE